MAEPDENAVNPHPGDLSPEESRAAEAVTRKMSAAGGTWQPPTDEEIVQIFPQYEMLGMLGCGGMGAVYKARQVALDRFVALKLLPLEISVDKEFADRFVREARAMAKLNHPNVLDVYDFGVTEGGHLFFVMEFVDGANLHSIIHGQGLNPDQALWLAGQICDALAYAHSKGVVHRDIKPANVMVSMEGHAKVADFGLARVMGPGAEQPGLTVSGTVMGTPDYMAPEQKRGMNVDHRADIYSLGVMLYEMLCKETPQGIFDPPSAKTGCDLRIDQIVMKAMQAAPERRYQSTEEMKVEVDAARIPLPQPRATPEARVAAPLPTSAPGKSNAKRYVGLVAAAILLVGTLAFFATSKPTKPRVFEGEAASATTPIPNDVAGTSAEKWEDLIQAGGWTAPWAIENGVLTRPAKTMARRQWNDKVRDGAWRVTRRWDAGWFDLQLGLRTTGQRGLRLHFDQASTADVIRLLVGRDDGAKLAFGQTKKRFQKGDIITVEFRAVGREVTASIDGEVVVTAHDDTPEAGLHDIWTNYGDAPAIHRVEFLNLD